MGDDAEYIVNTFLRWLPFVTIAIGALAYPALKEKLRAWVASKDELNGQGSRLDRDIAGLQRRVDVMETSMSDFDTRMDHKRERILRLEERDRHAAETMGRLVVEPLERVAQRMENIATMQTQQGRQIERATAHLEALAGAVARLERRVDRDNRG